MKSDVKYCDGCKFMIKPRDLCICINIDIATEERLLKVRDNHLRMINEMAKDNPDYLTTITFYEPGVKYSKWKTEKSGSGCSFLDMPVGLFKCKSCGIIIGHKQYRFCGCCGACDVGKPRKAPYKIIKNEEGGVE